MSEQNKNPSPWAAALKTMKLELGMLAFIIIGAVCCMPFIYAAAWLISKMPAWMLWPVVAVAGLCVLFQETIKAAWRAFRGAKP